MATKKYLDDTGLSYFWSKVKAKIPDTRIFTTLIPTGTKVTGNLNTVNYLKVGTYYNNSDAEVKKLTNCPTTYAFMMEVYSPLSSTIDNESTAAWVYRLRVLTTYKGAIYYQAVSSGGTAGSFSYGSWSQVAKKSDIPNLSNYVTKSYAEEKYYNKYDIEQITKSDYSDTYTETFTSVTIPASSSVKVMDYPEDGDWNDNTTRILLVKEDGNLVDSTLLPVTCQSDGIYVKNTETESITVDLEITIANKKSFRNATVFYATCSSASSSTAKELVATNIPAPFAGMHLSVRFTYGFVNTPVSLFWNDTYLGEVVSSGTTTGVALDVRPDQMVELVYDGTYWHCLNIVEATTDYYGITRLTNSVTSNSTDTAATPKSVKQAYDLANSKQDALVSGTNIKTINGNSLLGSGDITISGGSSTNQKTWYGTCDTAAGTATKVVSCENFELEDGAHLSVWFSNGNTANTAKLNVNSTGAKSMAKSTSDGVVGYAWQQGAVVDFVYKASNELWIMIRGAEATTTYYGVTKLSSSTSSTSTSLAATPSAVKAAYDLANSQKTTITTGSITTTNIYVNGKQVYVKRISISALPNATTSNISIGITQAVTPYKFEGMAYRSTDKTYLPIPYIAGGTSLIGLNYGGTNKILYLSTSTDRRNMSGYIDFYFTYD